MLIIVVSAVSAFAETGLSTLFVFARHGLQAHVELIILLNELLAGILGQLFCPEGKPRPAARARARRGVARTRIGDCGIIHSNVTIGEDVTIGHHVLIYPGVVIYPKTKIGDNVILHAGCIVGSDGFGNAPQEDGTWKKIEHLGGVVIGNDVEIGTNTTIDRAEMENTIIGNGVRIDNLCQIAHNVVIGDNTVMAAQVGIAGSTEIGKNCIIAGQVGIVGHVTIADNSTICSQAGVIGNIRKSGEVWFGTPAIRHKDFLRSYALFKKAGEDK